LRTGWARRLKTLGSVDSLGIMPYDRGGILIRLAIPVRPFAWINLFSDCRVFFLI